MPLSPGTPGTVILRDAPPAGEPRWLAFTDPERVLAARTVDEVAPLLRAVEEAVAVGLFAAGFVAYEAAPAFDPACRTRPPSAAPGALPGCSALRRAAAVPGPPPLRAPPRLRRDPLRDARDQLPHRPSAYASPRATPTR